MNQWTSCTSSQLRATLSCWNSWVVLMECFLIANFNLSTTWLPVLLRTRIWIRLCAMLLQMSSAGLTSRITNGRVTSELYRIAKTSLTIDLWLIFIFYTGTLSTKARISTSPENSLICSELRSPKWLAWEISLFPWVESTSGKECSQSTLLLIITRDQRYTKLYFFLFFLLHVSAVAPISIKTLFQPQEAKRKAETEGKKTPKKKKKVVSESEASDEEFVRQRREQVVSVFMTCLENHGVTKKEMKKRR